MQKKLEIFKGDRKFTQVLPLKMRKLVNLLVLFICIFAFNSRTIAQELPEEIFGNYIGTTVMTEASELFDTLTNENIVVTLENDGSSSTVSIPVDVLSISLDVDELEIVEESEDVYKISRATPKSIVIPEITVMGMTFTNINATVTVLTGSKIVETTLFMHLNLVATVTVPFLGNIPVDIDIVYEGEKENIAILSDDATLSNLTVSVGTLEPAFNPAEITYSVTVPYENNTITITATTNNSAATLTGDGIKSLSVGNGNVFQIVVTAEDEIETKTYTVTVTRDDLTGINNNTLANELQVYPNPNYGQFTINLNNIESAKTFQVIDIKGSIVTEQNITDKLQNVKINLQSGNYILKVFTDTQVYIEQIIVK